MVALKEMIAAKKTEIEQINKRQAESREDLVGGQNTTVEDLIENVRKYEKMRIGEATRDESVIDLDGMLAASDMEPLGSTLDANCSEDIAILLTVIKMDESNALIPLFTAYTQASEVTTQASEEIDRAEKMDSEKWKQLKAVERERVIDDVFEKLKKQGAGSDGREGRTLTFDAVEKLVKWYEAWGHAGYQMVDDIDALRSQLNNEYMASILSGRKHEWFADPAEDSYHRLTKAREAPRSVIQKNMHILFQNDIFLPAVQCLDLGILTEVKDHSKMYSSRKGRGELHDTSESKSLLIRRANMLKRFRTKQNDFTKRG